MLSEDSFDLVLGESENGWDLEWLDPGSKAIFVGFAVIEVLLGLELSEEDEAVSGDTVLLGAGGFVVVVEGDLILRLGKFGVSVGIKGVLVV